MQHSPPLTILGLQMSPAHRAGISINKFKRLKKQEMINKVGIQLYSDLVIFSVLVFIKSPCTSLGPVQSTTSILGQE